MAIFSEYDSGTWLGSLWRHIVATNYGHVPLGTRVSTGHVCPESGVWKVDGNPSTTAPLAKGNVMPPYGGKAVTWTLIQYA